MPSAIVENAPKVIKEALKRFQTCVDAEYQRRTDTLNDWKFLKDAQNSQWPDAIKKQRENDGRPCLTINRLEQFLRQVTNEQRQNRPAIKVSPVDDKADPDTAEVIQGMIRHIEYDSNADTAYDTAFEFAAATGGPGWIWVYPEYDDDEKKTQVLKIRRVRNPFTVYDDPSAQEADRSDSKFRFKVENLTKDEYKSLYPKSQLASLDDWGSVGDLPGGWLAEDSVRIVEYYYFEDETEKDEEKESKSKESTESEKEYGSKGQRLCWVKMNAVEELERTEIPCRWIPSVPVFGDEVEIDGKVMVKGIVRDAKDPQRMYNYWASKETEAISLAPSVPYVGIEGQFEGHESKWQTANTKNWAYLEYKPTDAGGNPAPNPPTRTAIEPAVQAITQARLASADDLKATTGIYDASLGNRSNEQTGKAILARQQQGQIANFHYIDNLTRSIRHLGRILLDWIPKIYDTPRVLRIIGEDGDHDVVNVNKPFEKGGVQKLYDLTVGKYDVTIASGPSYQTRRMEAVQSILALVSAQPALLNIAGDLLVKMMDWPMHEQVAERLKKMLPPQLQDDEDDSAENKLVRTQAQLQALAVQHEQLTQVVQKQTDIINQKQVESQAKIQIEQIHQETEKLKIEAQIAIAEINTKAQEARERMKLEADMNAKLHVSAHEVALQKDSQAHEQNMTAASQAHEQQMAERGHEQAMEEQDAAGQQAMMQQQMAQESSNG